MYAKIRHMGGPLRLRAPLGFKVFGQALNSSFLPAQRAEKYLAWGCQVTMADVLCSGCI